MGQSLPKQLKEDKSSEGNIVKKGCLTRMPKQLKFGEKEDKSVKKSRLSRIVEELVSNDKILTPLATHFGTQQFLMPISLACGSITLTCGVLVAYMASMIFKNNKKKIAGPAPKIKSVIILCQDQDGNLVAITPPATPAP
ncbi:hypothetical protein ACHQM5_025423 [Ranunculus cassubicifolius]